MLDALLMFLLFTTSLFLILLVLVQRGRGGGLAGAFGGLGGQSAFGTKAGDLFTRITIFVAAFWIILCAASVKYFSESGQMTIGQGLGKNAASAPNATGTAPRDATGKGAPAGSSAAPGATGTPANTSTPPAGSAAPATDSQPAASEPAGEAAPETK